MENNRSPYNLFMRLYYSYDNVCNPHIPWFGRLWHPHRCSEREDPQILRRIELKK